jgi:intraflagellar transport protein 74
MEQNSRILSSRAGFQRPVTGRPLTSARPITTTGLIAPRTSRGKSGLRRQIQDKSYFMSLLRSKITELSAEIGTLGKECDLMAKEEARIGVYQKKAEGLAKELASMTQELAVYNEYNDRLRIREDEDEIKEDIKALKTQNEEYTEKLEISYEKKKKHEQLIVNHENELQKIHNNWINLKRQFTAEENETFDMLEKTNEKLSLECEQLESQISGWREKRNQIETNSENNDSLIKREILQAVAKLRDLEKQRNYLVSESNNSGDERGRLLAQVKRDNNEITAMEIKINSIKEEIQEIKNELESYEDVGATLKYKELKKKEETIDQFLDHFEVNKSDQINKMEIIGAEINELTGKLSRCLTHIETLKGNMNTNETERSRNNSGKSSIETLKDDRRKLELDLNKIEQLETKINSELESLKNKIQNLESDIQTYSDIPKLKAQIEDKLHKLQTEKQQLIETSSQTTKNNENFKSQLNKLKTSLDNNDINKKIKILETKLTDILSTNESIKSTVNIGINTNLKSQVLEDIKKYNQKLLGY